MPDGAAQYQGQQMSLEYGAKVKVGAQVGHSGYAAPNRFTTRGDEFENGHTALSGGGWSTWDKEQSAPNYAKDHNTPRLRREGKLPRNDLHNDDRCQLNCKDPEVSGWTSSAQDPRHIELDMDSASTESKIWRAARLFQLPNPLIVICMTRIEGKMDTVVEGYRVDVLG
ncbi:hypothetical protein BV22DRAFT_1117062 [Leucogyrophana mollusca]|uniref:Uncharacterized protein n=1 Tax=Leucogyrophana mollusca TaxID=85980 RepID=A0ACB8BU68_9AGAM|nr:hypothetical protein BV22DRAFT_1117062 [Leucogyrophana mollusca]